VRRLRDGSDHAVWLASLRQGGDRAGEWSHAMALITGGWREVDLAYVRIGLTRQ
jgi:hypothetical protein